MNVFSTVEVPKFKTVFLGETAVGKSSICLRIINNRFEEFIESTIGASFMNYSNEKAYLSIWDTAGQERYRSLAPLYYRGAEACIMVYDVTKKDSFKQLRNWMAAIYEKGEDPLVLIIGNKIDSPDRQVTKQQGQEYAEMIGALFFETSAKTGQNVFEAVNALIEQLLLRYQMNQKTTAFQLENESFQLKKKINTSCC